MQVRAPTASPRAPFLFSVDLEDVRSMIPDGMRYRDGVVSNTQLYLELLAAHDVRATFFVVGDVARRHPELLRSLVEAGHEVASHTSDHLPLVRQEPEGFRSDLARSRQEIEQAAASPVVGFRAPVFSLTPETVWAYQVLAEQGFRYSSSVLPHQGPLYGWKHFGSTPRRTPEGIWEFPVSAARVLGRSLPFAGGVYFRLLPFALTRRLFEGWPADAPVVGYFHPYDVDTEQEHFMHPELGGSRALNLLMYAGRRRVIPRLEQLLANGFRSETFANHLARSEHEAPSHGE